MDFFKSLSANFDNSFSPVQESQLLVMKNVEKFSLWGYIIDEYILLI